MWSAVNSVTGANGIGKAEAPCGRAKHSAALVGRHVYVLAGRGAGGSLPLRDFWRYDLDACRWEKLAGRGCAPPALLEHSMVAHGERLYVFGGEPASCEDEVPLWLYDIQAGEWRKVGSERARGRRDKGERGPGARRGHVALALADCMLLHGGYRDLRGSSDELWAFHYERETWCRVSPRGGAAPARHRHGACAAGAKLYLHAGLCGLRHKDDLWVYHTESRNWTPVKPRSGPGPGPRAGHALVRAGGALYAFGGDTPNARAPASDLWRFHTGAEYWERIETSDNWPSARADCRLLLIGRAPKAAKAAKAVKAPEAAKAAEAAECRPGRGFLRSVSDSAAAAAQRLRRATAPRGSYAALALQPALSADSLALEGAREGREGREGPQGEGLPHSRSAYAVPLGAEAELADSDYASLEGVHRLSASFTNPNYLDLGPTTDVPMRDLSSRLNTREAPAAPAPELHLLLVGGREPAHPALLSAPLSMWTFRLL